MPPTDPTGPHSPRTFGPIQIRSTSLIRQGLGFVLTVIGLHVLSWTVYTEPILSSAVIHTAIGAFIVFNGLYLGGVRFR